METTRTAEPEKIIPASPFAIVFRSPDLATDDDLPAPSAATERKAHCVAAPAHRLRRQPPAPAPQLAPNAPRGSAHLRRPAGFQYRRLHVSTPRFLTLPPGVSPKRIETPEGCSPLLRPFPAVACPTGWPAVAGARLHGQQGRLHLGPADPGPGRAACRRRRPEGAIRDARSRRPLRLHVRGPGPRRRRPGPRGGGRRARPPARPLLRRPGDPETVLDGTAKLASYTLHEHRPRRHGGPPRAGRAADAGQDARARPRSDVGREDGARRAPRRGARGDRRLPAAAAVLQLAGRPGVAWAAPSSTPTTASTNWPKPACRPWSSTANTTTAGRRRLQSEMADRLDCECVVVPGAVHSPAVEAPETTAAALTRFWNIAESAMLAR